ncbi:MAG: alpha-ribazole phosphatase family protein [Pseudomonadota bacterium]
MALTLLRHTTPDGHAGLCYGRLNLDLADSFFEEAHAALTAIGEIASIYSSPLSRCLRLAEYIAEQRGLSVTVEPQLIEMDFGRWEGRPWADLPREELNAWAEDFMHARPHGGESVAMLRDRTSMALTEISRSELGNTALCVTHSGVIKAAMADGDQSSNYDLAVPFGGHVTWHGKGSCS